MALSNKIELVYNIGAKKITAYLIEPYDDEIFFEKSLLLNIERHILEFYRKKLKQDGDGLRITYTDVSSEEHNIQTQLDWGNFYWTCRNNWKLQIYPVINHPSSTVPELTSTEMLIHYHLHCDGCKSKLITGFRYMCLQCPHFDLCEHCEFMHKHSDHMMLRLARHTFPRKVFDLFIVHDGVTCDGCSMRPIIGNRYKCIECPDYDICQNCETKHSNSHIKHQMMRFTRHDRIGTNAVNDANSVAANVSCNICKCRPILGCRYKCLYCYNFNVCQRCESQHRFAGHTMVRLSKNTNAVEYVMAIHTDVICDGCGTNSIKGFRYKCIQCEDFDLCELCESRHKHNDHMMVRLPNTNNRNHISSWANLLLTQPADLNGAAAAGASHSLNDQAPSYEELYQRNTNTGRISPPPPYSDCVLAENNAGTTITAEVFGSSERANNIEPQMNQTVMEILNNLNEMFGKMCNVVDVREASELLQSIVSKHKERKD